MTDLIAAAESRLAEIRRRVSAHDSSAEYHRHRNVLLGGIAKAVSAVLGAGVFVALLSKLGLDAKGKLEVPAGWKWLYWTALAISLAGPALTAVQSYLNDAEDVAKHTASSSAYRELADKFVVLLSRPPTDSQTLEVDFLKLSDEFKNIYEKSIQLTPRAKRGVQL